MSTIEKKNDDDDRNLSSPKIRIDTEFYESGVKIGEREDHGCGCYSPGYHGCQKTTFDKKATLDEIIDQFQTLKDKVSDLTDEAFEHRRVIKDLQEEVKTLKLELKEYVHK